MGDQVGALYLGHHCALGEDGHATRHTVDQLRALVAAGRDCEVRNKEFGVLIEGTADVYGAHSYSIIGQQRALRSLGALPPGQARAA